MTDFQIEVGATNGFRYVGIQPPLDGEQLAIIEASVELNLGFHTRTPDLGGSFTEGSSMTGRGDEDDYIVKAAHQIKSLLENMGNSVAADYDVQPIGNGYHLFGGQDKDLI